MNPYIFIAILTGYFGMLMLLSFFSSRNANSQTFFTANRKSPWYLVAFGMIGATISGVTFISVPGEVGNSGFSYFQFILGNFAGYWLVAMILLPLYYRLGLVSIYTFLEQRFGYYSYKTGSFFFLISKIIGAAFRLYLVAGVLQIAIFDAFGIPFFVTVVVSIFLIWVYTFRGGIKTVIWADALQTVFLLTAVIFTILSISKMLNLDFGQMVQSVSHSPHSKIFSWEWASGSNFFKQFFAGMFTTIVIVGMDQDMMQKNLTCKSRKDAQKNMVVFSFAFVVTVFLFLCLGAMLYLFAETKGIAVPKNTDDLYPILAMNHFGLVVAIAFLLGITAAAYSSADSALTALTTSFCVDFLNFGNEANAKSERIRKIVHLFFSVVIILVILLFKVINNESVVVAVFKMAGYTYGPILGLFIFGIYTNRKVYDRFVPIVAVAAPVVSYFIAANSEYLLSGYKFGFEVLILNGLLTFTGLLLVSRKS